MPTTRMDEPQKNWIKAIVKFYRKATGIAVNEQFACKRIHEFCNENGFLEGENLDQGENSKHN